ncbi:MAG: FAD:protein FMN transferase [Thermoanaerobaculia bacterium]
MERLSIPGRPISETESQSCRRAAGLLGALLGFALTAAGGEAALARAPARPVSIERRILAMGTVLDVQLVAKNRAQGLEQSEIAAAEIRRIEDLLTTWKPGSPLDLLNRAPVGRPVPVDSELLGLLETVLDWAQRTGGAFDPTVLPLVTCWGLRAQGRVPGADELARARRAVGPGAFRLDAAHGAASRLLQAAGFDEGAWAKGYALDRASARLRDSGVQGALLNLGGQVLTSGRDLEGRPWRVGIADPRQRRRIALAIDASGLSVSTSGNSERSKTAGGRTIGHLLDPRTGQPAPDFGSATVIARSGLLADVLSSACFVLGPQRGLALSEELRRQGIDQEVIFLVARAGEPSVIASPGARALLSGDRR